MLGNILGPQTTTASLNGQLVPRDASLPVPTRPLQAIPAHSPETATLQPWPRGALHAATTLAGTKPV